MFNTRERTFTLFDLQEQDTSFGKQSVETELRQIKAKIFTRAGNTTVNQNVLITNSTHFAITKDKAIRANMKLISENESYTIDYVINDGPEAQLFLKAVQ